MICLGLFTEALSLRLPFFVTICLILGPITIILRDLFDLALKKSRILDFLVHIWLDRVSIRIRHHDQRYRHFQSDAQASNLHKRNAHAQTRDSDIGNIQNYAALFIILFVLLLIPGILIFAFTHVT